MRVTGWSNSNPPLSQPQIPPGDEEGEKFKGGAYSRIHSHKNLPFRDGGSTDVITTNCLITNIVMGPGDSHKYEGIKSKLILCHVNYFHHGSCYSECSRVVTITLQMDEIQLKSYFFFFRILFSVN